MLTYIIQFFLGAGLIAYYPILVHTIANLNEGVTGVEKSNPTRISAMATTMISIKEAAIHSSLFIYIILFVCNDFNFSYFLTLAGAIITYYIMIRVLDVNAAGMWTRRRR